MNRAEIKRILLITLSNLGDIILTTPVLEKLRDEFPQAEIDVITGAPGMEIFERCPAVRNVTVREKRPSLGERIRQVRDLRKAGYDLVVDLKRSLIPYLVGSRYRSAMSVTSADPDIHKMREHLLKLEGLVPEPLSENRFFLPVRDGEKKYIEQMLGDDWKRLVVINPGAKSHLKRWDAVKFARLADRIVSEFKCKVFLTGNDDDKDMVGRVASSVTTPVKDLCSMTTLGALAELMRRADLVITNDSAPLHVASAVGAPTIAIFGPSDEKKYGPLSEKSVVVKPDVPCRPCGKALCDIGPDEGCLSRVEVEDVLREARRMLAGNV